MRSASELRAILPEPHLLGAHLLLAFRKARLRKPKVVLCALEGFTRRELLFPQLLLPREILLCDRELHARGFNGLTRLFEAGLIRLTRRLPGVPGP